jgi:hypothetical protein
MGLDSALSALAPGGVPVLLSRERQEFISEKALLAVVDVTSTQPREG